MRASAAPYGRAANWRKRAAGVGPIGVALGAHLILIWLIMGWRPPPVGLPARSVEISLVSAHSGTGLVRQIENRPSPKLAKPDAALSSLDSLAAAKTASATRGDTLSAKPLPNAPKDLVKSVADLASAGVIVTAQPLPMAAHAAAVLNDTLQTAGGKGCEIGEAVQGSLQASVLVQHALSSIPSKSRSVSNAVLLWDGQWIDAPSVGGAGVLATIQQTVTHTIEHAPLSCQTQIVHGPQLVIVNGVNDTIVVAFGSGNWRWKDMTATAPPNS